MALHRTANQFGEGEPQILADKFFLRLPHCLQEFVGFRVEIGKAPIRVHGDEAVGHALDNIEHVVARFAQRSFGREQFLLGWLMRRRIAAVGLGWDHHAETLCETICGCRCDLEHSEHAWPPAGNSFCAEHEAQQRTGGLGVWQGGLIPGTNQRKSPFGGPRKAYSHDTTTAPLLQETPARGDAAKFWEGLNKSLVFRPSLGWKTDGATKTDERQVSSPASKNTPYVCHRTDRARFVG